jgi:hypothetical protein
MECGREAVAFIPARTACRSQNGEMNFAENKAEASASALHVRISQFAEEKNRNVK